MRKTTTTIMVIAMLVMLAVAGRADAANEKCPGAYIEPGISVDVNNEGLAIYVGSENAGEHLTVRVGKTLVFKGTVDPYFSWANIWPDNKQVLTLQFRGGNRYVWTPDCG